MLKHREGDELLLQFARVQTRVLQQLLEGDGRFVHWELVEGQQDNGLSPAQIKELGCF
jgi:hypothetical protein